MSISYPITLNQVFTHTLNYPYGGITEIENNSRFYLYVALSLRATISDIVNQNVAVIPPLQRRSFRNNLQNQNPVLSLVATDQPFALAGTINQTQDVARISEYSDPKLYYLDPAAFQGLSAEYIVIAGGKIIASQQGITAIDDLSLPSFALAGINGFPWDGTTLDRGDLQIGQQAGNYLLWDASLGTLTVKGSINITGGNAASIAYVDGHKISGVAGSWVCGLNTLQYTSIVVKYADGHTQAVTDNTLPGVVSRTYLSIDPAGGSPTAFRIDTVLANIPASYTIVAVVDPGTIKTNVQVVAGGTFISGDWINTGTVTAQNIKAATITANEIAANTLKVGNLIAGFQQFLSNPDPLNALLEPGFEQAGLYWLAASNVAVINNATNAHSGNRYLQLTSPGGTLSAFTYETDENQAARYHEVVPGATAMIGGYAYKESGNASAYISAQILDKDLGFISNIAVSVSGAAWTRYSTTAVIPSNGKYLLFVVSMVGDGSTTTVCRYDDLFMSIQLPGSGIVASSITADRLTVSQLSAISADLGSITAGTITGALIRTAASGGRIELSGTGFLTRFLTVSTASFDLWRDGDNDIASSLDASYIGTSPNKALIMQWGIGNSANYNGSGAGAGEVFRIACGKSGIQIELLDTATNGNQVSVNLPTATSALFKIRSLTSGTTTDKVVINAPGDIQTAGKLGVNGNAAQGKLSVTGSRGGNAALASLLTAMASYGFITDNTTA